MNLNRMFTIVGRDLRRWARDRRAMMFSILAPLFFPLLGFILSGEFKDLPVGTVGSPAGVPETLKAKEYADMDSARRDLVLGKIYAYVSHGEALVDNSNPPIAAAIERLLLQKGTVVKPFWPKSYQYIHFFLPAIVVVAIFMSSYQGGGMPIVHDRDDGIIAKYLVTPVTRTEFLTGSLLAGFLKSLASALLSLMIVLLALWDRYTAGLAGIANISLVILLSTAGFLGMSVWLALMLSYNLYYPLGMVFNMLSMTLSGLLYPIESLPRFLRFIAALNPMTYGIHASRTILLKNGSLLDQPVDFLFLAGFAVVMFILGALSLRNYSVEKRG